MGRTLDQMIAELPPGRRKKVASRAKELIADEMSLQDLRKAMRLTQVAMAKRLGVGQDTVSRAESRTDMLISTLAEHVGAMGGKLEIIARFPARPPVRLQELGVLSSRRPAAGRRRKASEG